MSRLQDSPQLSSSSIALIQDEMLHRSPNDTHDFLLKKGTNYDCDESYDISRSGLHSSFSSSAFLDESNSMLVFPSPIEKASINEKQLGINDSSSPSSNISSLEISPPSAILGHLGSNNGVGGDDSLILGFPSPITDSSCYQTPIQQSTAYKKRMIFSDYSSIGPCSIKSDWSDVPLSELSNLKTPLKRNIQYLPDSTPRNVVNSLVLTRGFLSSEKRKSLKAKKMNISGSPQRIFDDLELSILNEDKENSDPQTNNDGGRESRNSSSIFSSLKDLKYYNNESSTCILDSPPQQCDCCKSKDREIEELKRRLFEQEKKYNDLLKEHQKLILYNDNRSDILSDISTLSSGSNQSDASTRKTLRNVISFENAKFIKLYCRVRNYTQDELEIVQKNQTNLSTLITHSETNLSFETSSQMLEGQIQDETNSVVATDETRITIRKYLKNSMTGMGSKMSKYEFHFDKVFGYNTDNEEVTDSLSSFIDRVIYDEPQQRLTVMAYGATGSGKTFTIHAILNYVQNMLFSPEKSRIIRAVYFNCFEIYNEQTLLLLSRDVDDFIRVDSIQDLERLLVKSQNKRKCAETEYNKRSSRSHCIYRFKVSFVEQEDEQYYNILNVIDLAGSEKLSSDEFIQNQSKDSSDFRDLKKIRNSETVNINKSLSVLSQVIKGLAQGSKFVNYRDSVLTKILKNDLSQVALIVNIKPPTQSKDKIEIEKIVNSLTFAKKANAFEITKSNVK